MFSGAIHEIWFIVEMGCLTCFYCVGMKDKEGISKAHKLTGLSCFIEQSGLGKYAQNYKSVNFHFPIYVIQLGCQFRESLYKQT